MNWESFWKALSTPTWVDWLHYIVVPIGLAILICLLLRLRRRNV